MKQTILVALFSFIVLQVSCGSRIEPSLRRHNHKETFEDFVCPEPNGVFPSETCSDYYLCVEGVPYVQHCPGSSVFDPQTQVCVPPGGQSCQAVTTTTRQTPTTTVSSSTPSSTTPSSTTPSSTTQSSSTFSTTPSTTTTASTGFTCPSSNGFYPVPESPCSNLYYTCIGGVPYLSTCPGDSIFDPVSLVCVSPGSSSCSQIFQCPSDNGSFPVPGACSSTFFTCISGVPYEQKCFEDYVFDPILLKCVPPEEASC